MIRAWCKERLNPGDWVLEPFGFNPIIPIEIADAGHPVLVTINNPIHAFLLRVLASAPQEDDLLSALQELATSTKGEERMESYIRSFYQLKCLDCGKQIEAEGFVWKKGADQPYASLVECPFCGAHGEQIFNQETLSSLKPLPNKQFHFARALNRIAEINDDLRPDVENALNAYPLRPLVILQTIINKLETLDLSPKRRDLLTALILSAADKANTLWAYPTPRDRPRQIVIPTVFLEKNLWKVLIESIQTWQIYKSPISIKDWDGEPKSTEGIYLFQGRFKELDLKAENDIFSAVITTIPRPNQAFWTLSALWTGWIWGQEAVAPIRRVISRQRYDWNWHTNALTSVFGAIHKVSNAADKFLGIITENEPMFLLTALLAANQAGFQLKTFSQESDEQIAQCLWQRAPESLTPVRPEPAIEIAHLAAETYIRNKGEPASYQQIHAAAITELANQNQLAVDIFTQNPNQATSETQKWIDSLFQISDRLVRIPDGTTSLETGEWWLRSPTNAITPLIDRVENTIVQYLKQERTTTAQAIKKMVFQSFPGLFTPRANIILTCLESYANLMDTGLHLWELKDSEKDFARKNDINIILNSIRQIGDCLKFKVAGENPLLWFSETADHPDFKIIIISSANIPIEQFNNHPIAKTNIIVLPGSRANLLAFKEQRNPVLKQTLRDKCIIVKFRLIRDLEANPLLTRELFFEQIQVDPPEYHASQLALF
jgi:hypothetical protein